MNKGDKWELDWDTGTGKPPKTGQVIKNFYGMEFKVIKVKGNKVTLEQITENI